MFYTSSFHSQLKASEIRVTNGTLETCYDPRGALYSVPRFVFSDPVNVVDGPDFEEEKFKQHHGAVVTMNLKFRLSSSVSCYRCLLSALS